MSAKTRSKGAIPALAYQLTSFKYAFKGLCVFWGSEMKARIHLFISIIAIALGACFDISLVKWALLILTIALVIICEILNTALEMLVDKISPEYNLTAGKIKDLTAGAVLISAIAAAAIGCLIFIPEFF
jgi:diacylglycerol kinase (ATP)